VSGVVCGEEVWTLLIAECRLLVLYNLETLKPWVFETSDTSETSETMPYETSETFFFRLPVPSPVPVRDVRGRAFAPSV
jgi:hypothetical protein